MQPQDYYDGYQCPKCMDKWTKKRDTPPSWYRNDEDLQYELCSQCQFEEDSKNKILVEMATSLKQIVSLLKEIDDKMTQFSSGSPRSENLIDIGIQKS